MKNYPLLDQIDKLNLHQCSIKELQTLAKEIREFLITTLKQTGGHLSSNLGVVELTLALYHTFNPPSDRLVFDVSHQAYVHKILSGRKDRFHTIRQKDGLSGFTNPKESPYDSAQLGHAGTAASIAMGIQQSHMMHYSNIKDAPFTIAIIGDASIPNGVAFEALNNLSSLDLKKLVIILNDNQMSISETVGGLSKVLTKVISHPFYNRFRFRAKKLLYKTKVLSLMAYRAKKTLKRMFYGHNVFEELGIRYIGPVDGHDIKSLSHLFKTISSRDNKSLSPVLIHVITKKGKGDSHSEQHPEKYHGVPSSQTQSVSTLPLFTKVVEEYLPKMKEKYPNITATTAAMKQGTGLSEFARLYPNHFFDVGIAESHAVAFSAFLSRAHNFKPFILIYSTFLQRALDQIFQEVILQDGLNPVFLIDRAGFVGDDGVTHHGLYDIAYLKMFPRAVLMSPKSKEELESMMEFAYHQENPVFIRYPKTFIPDHQIIKASNSPIELGKSEWIVKNPNAQYTVFTYGSLITEILDIIDQIPPCNLINLRFAKPLDYQLLNEIALLNHPIITLEEHMQIGGVGESVSAYLNSLSHFKSRCAYFGIPDTLLNHASRDDLLIQAGLKGEALQNRINQFLL